MTIESLRRTVPGIVQRYHQSKRVKARHDIALGLFRTHVFDPGDTPIDTDALFPDRAQPVTFATSIAKTGAAPAGIVFEFGSATTGLKLAVSGSDLFVAAGAASGDSGVDGSVTVQALSGTGVPVDVVLAVIPGSGEVRLWANGRHVLRLASVNPMTAWADGDDGAVGAAEAGTGSTQRGQTINGAPTDFQLLQRCEAFDGSVPRSFDR